MQSSPTVLDIVEAKGWHLYKARRRDEALAALVAPGPTRILEPDVPYEILPAASRPDDIAEVQTHVANARRTGQLPTYRDDARSPVQVGLMAIRDEGLIIKRMNSDDAYCIRPEEITDGLQLNLSTYNVHFFSCIDEVVELFRRLAARGKSRVGTRRLERRVLHLKAWRWARNRRRDRRRRCG